MGWRRHSPIQFLDGSRDDLFTRGSGQFRHTQDLDAGLKVEAVDIDRAEHGCDDGSIVGAECVRPKIDRVNKDFAMLKAASGYN